MGRASEKSRIAFRELVALGAAGIVLLLLAPVAQADFTFGPKGAGAGELNGSQFARSMAFDYVTNELFVGDGNNNRVAVFDSEGDFLRAFGWDVAPDGAPGDTALDQLEICTTSCQAGIAGSNGGQLDTPRSIAIDSDPLSPTYHDVFVSEASSNFRIQRFSPAGEFELAFGDGVNQTTGGDVCTAASGDTCKVGTQGEGAGQFAPDTGNALNVPRLAVGEGGTVHVADYTPAGARLQRFDSSGTFLSQIVPLPSTPPATAAMGLAVEPGGDFYVTTNGGSVARKYDPAGNLLDALDSGTGPIALDPSGGLLVSSFASVARYDSADNLIGVHYGNGTLTQGFYALVPFSNTNGDFFAWEGSGPIAHVKFEPPGPVVVPETTKAPNPRSARATLEALVNPEGKSTTFHFEYITEADFVANGNSFEGANPPSTTTESAPIGSDFKAHTAKQEVTGLAPETTYRFRVIASNADAPTGVKGPGATFTTLEPIELLGSWSTRVSTDSVRLSAEVNPLGTAATGFFEYVDLQSFEEQGESFEGPATQKTASFEFGAGEEPVVRSAQLFPLEPDTAYRFRFIAENHCTPDPEVVCTFTEEPEVRGFRTFPPTAGPKACPNEAFRSGVGAALPDCRAYEMVSPLEKANGDIVTLNELSGIGLKNPKTLTDTAKAHVNQATPQGDAVAYSSYRSFGDAISTPYSSQYIARRDPAAGWSSHSINPPLEVPSLYLGANVTSLYKGFSEDLCDGFMLQDTDIALDGGAPAGVPNLYRRHNCGEDRYELLTTVAPSEPVPGWSRELEEESLYFPTVQGFSADGSATAFKAPAKLTPGGSEEDVYQAYLHKAGQLHLVSVLPDGVAANTHASVGTALQKAGARFYDSVKGAVSTDGSRVFWSAETDEPSTPVHGAGAATGSGPSALYLRLNATEEQSALASVTGEGKLSVGSSTVSSLVAAQGKGAFTTGSPIVTLSEVSVGQFVAGQPLKKIAAIPAGTTILEVNGTTLTLSANAIATNASATVSSEGPLPFAVGQSIAGPGILPQTRITAVGVGTLTLSKPASESGTKALTATLGCTESEKACTLAVSEGVARFIAADPQASKALYLESGDLYEFDVARAIAGEAGARKLIASEVQGVVGASEDLSRVYFPSGQVCSGAEPNSEGDVARAGQANLYLYEAGEECGVGELDFVGVVEDPGVDKWSWAPFPVDRMSRVSKDGEHAVFVSRTPLTGYDSKDSESGEFSAEVFLYDAAEAQLRCVSCNPGGGRPEAARNLGDEEKPDRYYVAAKIPGWETQWHASRALSEDGERLFFESFEALVLRDTNGKQDVYEWQRAQSKAECQEAGADLYVEEAGGCLSLISSGQSIEHSEFIDASADGRDVFFTTDSSLVPQDYGLVDIYDARIGGGFPSPIVDPGQPCEGEACQSPPPAPEDPAPASSAYEGKGNLPDVKPKPRPRACPKGKHRVRKAGKTRCVKKRGKASRNQGRRAGR